MVEETTRTTIRARGAATSSVGSGSEAPKRTISAVTRGEESHPIHLKTEVSNVTLTSSQQSSSGQLTFIMLTLTLNPLLHNSVSRLRREAAQEKPLDIKGW